MEVAQLLGATCSAHLIIVYVVVLRHITIKTRSNYCIANWIMNTVPIVISNTIIITVVASTVPQLLRLIVSNPKRSPLPVLVAVHHIAKLHNHIILYRFSHFS